jgi:sialic acid synthase SpsE
MDTVTINGRRIGEGERCFITFEAGPTHDGFDTALKLVEYAAAAGADAVKFQIVDPGRLCSDKGQMFEYQTVDCAGVVSTVREPIHDILCRRCMPRDQWRTLKARCDELGLIFFSTATFFDEVDFLEELGCQTLKICSGDVDFPQLIEYAARRGFCMQLDSGSATLAEVERAVDIVLATGNDKIIVHNCPSGYPARLESINLEFIRTLKRVFGFPVAFSDHTPGFEMDIAAVAMGANMIEKTITLDRTTPSVEHMFSLEPHEMARFVHTIREVEAAMQGRRRVMDDTFRH